MARRGGADALIAPSLCASHRLGLGLGSRVSAEIPAVLSECGVFINNCGQVRATFRT